MATQKKPTSSDGLTVKIVLQTNEDTLVSYANFAEVSHSQFEFAITAARVPTKLTPELVVEAKKGEVKIEPLLQLLLPPRVIVGLIGALQRQVASYESKFGPIAPTNLKASEDD